MSKINLSLRTKLLGCFAFLSLIVCLLGYVSHRQTVRLNQDLRDLGIVRMSAMRALMDGDMMHDTIRSCVVSALLAHTRHEDDFKAALAELDESMERFRRDMEKLAALPLDPESRRLYQRAQPEIIAYFARAHAVFTALQSAPQDLPAAQTAFNEQFTTVEETLGSFSERYEKLSEEGVATALDEGKRAVWVVNIAAVGGVVFAMLLGTSFTSWFSRSLRRVLAHLESASADTGAIVHQLTEAGGKLADRASSEAAALEETGSTLAHIASVSRSNTQDAASVRSLAQQTLSAADGGARDVAAMQEAMTSIRDASHNIAAIIKTIDEIAFQTNILALNAAVEAARAGEHGAGFAVVAEEVRALAQRSATAAKETAGKIEDALEKSERGAAISHQMAQSFTSILSQVRQVEELVRKISQSSTEQDTGIQQVNAAISSLGRSTQENAATAEESAAAGVELQSQIEALHEVARDLTTILSGAKRAEQFHRQRIANASPPAATISATRKTASPARELVAA